MEVISWPLLGIAALLFLVRAAAADSLPSSALDAMRNDAELADVYFVNPQRGWAVGDRGVIWHTRDGGQSWQQQQSNVHCRLSTVFFLDESMGWIAGGWTQPYTHISEGVVLRTIDGGQRWTPMRHCLVPALRRIKFFDRQHGAAFGEPSALFPSGVFTTDDGGQSWVPVPAARGQTWLAGDFVDPLTGAFAAGIEPPAVLRRRSLDASRSPPFGLRMLRAMQLAAPSSGWLVGDGGLIATTADLGQSWQTTRGRLPENAEGHFDFSALTVRAGHCWVAGAPGTFVFHSGDGGQTWQGRRTGSRVPIEALTFVDEMHGWAVGALGTILATRDGGKTWRRQRAGGGRAALAMFLSEPNTLPLELIAQLSADQGYLSVAHLLSRGDLGSPSNAARNSPLRAHDAVVEAGGSKSQTAWQFPLRDADLRLPVERLVGELDRANDGRGLANLENYVVRQIRTWQPEVVLTHQASATGENPLAYLINQVVLQSVDKAADPTSYVELATAAGLEPWQVKKVYAALEPGETGSTTLDGSQFEPRLGVSLADYVTHSRGLVAGMYQPPAMEHGFRLLVDRVPQERGRRDFFSGISLTPGGDARRQLVDPPADTLRQLRLESQQRRNMQEMIRRWESAPQRGAQWQAQLGDLTRGLGPHSSCQILFQLAGQYARSGRWEMAADTYGALVERHPEHPLAQSAQVWLLQYWASGEASWRMRKQSTVHVRRAAAVVRPPDDGSGEAQPATAIAAQQSDGLVTGDSTAGEHLARANELGKQIEGTQPELFAEPRLRFPLAVVHRKLGFGSQSERYLMLLRRTRTRDAWWEAAQGEHWLAEPSGDPPKPIWRAQRADRKPHLDGRLDEAFWQAAKPVGLRSDRREDTGSPAEARLAYDGQFLYIGVECRKAGSDYPKSQGVRQRDADLADRDRIDLLLDIDRDYASFYRLTVDHRGHTADACWGDPTWNPTWYVAAHSEGGQWTVEAAIALSELSGIKPEAGHVWAAGVQRIVPGVGFQSWNRPAEPNIRPEGFGYLRFE